MGAQLQGEGGVPEVDVKAAGQLHREGAARFLDVREPDEWDEGHIPGALHIPMAEIPRRLAEIPRDEPVILVCRSGARSGRATAFLAESGFTQVRNLEGGMLDWHEAGLPIE